jgi:catechol 2,3-dioxygenase-like lactoylglutathione lyase family enzyme
MATRVGQYCIYVKDIVAAERFYTDVIGLKVQSRTEIDDVHEVVVAADEGGGRLQLAERYNGGQPIDHGFALWKIYFNVDNCQEVYDKAMNVGCVSHLEPTRLERWPVIAAFFYDPDGYLVEILEYVDGATPPSGNS